MRSTTIVAFLFVLVAVLIVASASAQEDKLFDLRSFLVDNTDHFAVHRATPTKDGEYTIEIDPLRQVLFFNQNDTSTLKTTTFLNNTQTGAPLVSEIANFFTTFTENKNNTGTIKSADDEVILEFSFVSVQNIAIASGTIVATGETYQWTIPTPNSFVFTVFNKDSSVKDIYVAKKIFVAVEQSFWAKYGTYLMMFGLMAVNMWVQSKTRAQPAPEFDESIEQGPQQQVENKNKAAVPSNPQQPKNAQKSKKTD